MLSSKWGTPAPLEAVPPLLPGGAQPRVTLISWVSAIDALLSSLNATKAGKLLPPPLSWKHHKPPHGSG
ncbi:hypothetical protein PanWU01x14_192960 [Parasponia andersonii]|uniref:Uncharacterized protein n=1 Tax=Parasponia andersonii TaxID=3476 RepID=A0A2P5C163_PARAD|nr:hypothetical protein PanWU01x14_192960 [Parasponia andersonii]